MDICVHLMVIVTFKHQAKKKIPRQQSPCTKSVTDHSVSFHVSQDLERASPTESQLLLIAITLLRNTKLESATKKDTPGFADYPTCWIAGSHLHTSCLCSDPKFQSRLSRNTGSSSACPMGHVPRSKSKPTSNAVCQPEPVSRSQHFLFTLMTIQFCTQCLPKCFS